MWGAGGPPAGGNAGGQGTVLNLAGSRSAEMQASRLRSGDGYSPSGRRMALCGARAARPQRGYAGGQGTALNLACSRSAEMQASRLRSGDGCSPSFRRMALCGVRAARPQGGTPVVKARRLISQVPALRECRRAACAPGLGARRHSAGWHCVGRGRPARRGLRRWLRHALNLAGSRSAGMQASRLRSIKAQAFGDGYCSRPSLKPGRPGPL